MAVGSVLKKKDGTKGGISKMESREKIVGESSTSRCLNAQAKREFSRLFIKDRTQGGGMIPAKGGLGAQQ